MAPRGRQPANGTSATPDKINTDGGDVSDQSTPSSVVALLTASAANVTREEVQVNNASVTDMKHACDDALKRVSSLSLVFVPGWPFLRVSCIAAHLSCCCI
jgi:hypothetical protein